ncbi:tumor necrosis factor receptor superfamily member 1A [Hoplias malabaricus]|uniref:tumor necrosis factor receptor superfamily member 1A n=1 Tax=Hoplias malabaricus TaxID=27720 RepID=UPI003462F45E
MSMSTSLGVLALALIAAFLCQTGCCLEECLLSNQGCPPGCYKHGQSCKRCSPQFYNPNHDSRPECLPCQHCDSKMNKIVEHDCTADKDRVCACKKGFYKIPTFAEEFNCMDCEGCKNCSTCPECKDNCKPNCKLGQYLEKGICQPCADNHCKHEDCKPFCKKDKPEDWKLYLIIVPILLLGLLFILFYWTCIKKTVQLCEKNVILHIDPTGITPDVQIPVAVQPVTHIQVPMLMDAGTSQDEESRQTQRLLNMTSITAPLINEDTKGHGRYEVQKETWPAPVLYAIIRQIPVRRWKEFLRLLSVSDDQMERVELEAGPSYLEQQYQMLRLWSQRSGVDLENIYSTLHYMELSGCAQDLQENLQQLQNVLKPDMNMA